MNWKQLSIAPRRRGDIPALSLTRSGRINWNIGLHEALGHPTHVRLFYDGQRFGMQSCPPEATDACRVGRNQEQNSWYANARTALREVGILPKESSFRRRAEKDEESGIWFITLA